MRFHLHLSFHDSYEAKKDLALRDYLLKYPDEAQRYAEIKRLAIEEGNQTKDSYMQAKGPYIEKVVKLALEEK